jgi:hypothetical protein
MWLSYRESPSSNVLASWRSRRVKALGEPAVDVCQELVRLSSFALVLPQPTQAHRRPQLPRLGLLAGGQGQSLLEAGFRLGRIRGGLAQRQLALEAIRLCEQVASLTVLQRRQGLRQQAQPLVDLAGVPRSFGKQD